MAPLPTPPAMKIDTEEDALAMAKSAKALDDRQRKVAALMITLGPPLTGVLAMLAKIGRAHV